jgi:hypothetical protein
MLHRIAAIDPVFLVLGVVICYALIGFIRFYGPRSLVALLIIICVAMFAAPGGREILHTVHAIPDTLTRIRCASSAIAHGGLWHKRTARTISICRRRASGVPLSPTHVSAQARQALGAFGRAG